MSEAPFVVYAPPAKLATTEPFYRFAAEYMDIIQLFLFIITTATQMDQMQNTARKALAPRDTSVPKTSYAFTRVSYGYLLSRNLVTTMINNFSSYLSEVIQAAVSKRSEVLRSSEKLSTEEILQFTRVSDIVAYIADKKVNELSYGGLREMERFIAERLGLQLFATDDERKLLTIFIELRNITTHNRSIVNDLFLKRVGTHKFKTFSFTLGETHHVDFDEFLILAKNAMDVATRLDQQLIIKFKPPKRNLQKKLKTFFDARDKSMAKLSDPAPSSQQH